MVGASLQVRKRSSKQHYAALCVCERVRRRVDEGSEESVQVRWVSGSFRRLAFTETQRSLTHSHGVSVQRWRDNELTGATELSKVSTAHLQSH
jgi:hypothetical protein